MHELRPAFRRPFGSGPRAAVAVETPPPAAGCFAQHDAAVRALAGGPVEPHAYPAPQHA